MMYEDIKKQIRDIEAKIEELDDVMAFLLELHEPLTSGKPN